MQKIYVTIIAVVSAFILGVIAVGLILHSNEKLVIERHLMDSDRDISVQHPNGKPLTNFTDIVPEDTRSDSERIYDNLKNGYVSEFIEQAEIDCGDISIYGIVPSTNRMYFSLMVPSDSSDINLCFTFDTGDSYGTSLDFVPKDFPARAYVIMPENAKRVCLHTFTSKPALIQLGNVIDLTSDKDIKRVSNNTISFVCEKTRFFVINEENDLLDDVTLSGRGTFVTANGADYLVEVKNAQHVNK